MAADQVSRKKVGVLEKSLVEICVSQRGATQVRLTEVSAVEVKAVELPAGKVRVV
jgi:hypothetical protein